MSKTMKVALPSGTEVEASDRGYTISCQGGLVMDKLENQACDPYTNLQRGILAASNLTQET